MVRLNILLPDYTKKLPNEILLEIFKLLPCRDIVNITSTCKRYLQVGKALREDSGYKLWRKKTVAFWDIPEEIIANDDDDEDCNIITDEKRKIMLKYLIDQKFNIKRGDLIRLSSRVGYRNNGVAIYNGKEIIDLESEIDDYGYLPKEFKVIDEFPIGYFHSNFKGTGETEDGYEFITHNSIIWFDHKPYLPEILKNLTIGKPDIAENILYSIIFTYFTYKNGRRYYIIVCGEGYYSYDWNYCYKPLENAIEMVTKVLSDSNDIYFQSEIGAIGRMKLKENADVLFLDDANLENLS